MSESSPITAAATEDGKIRRLRLMVDITTATLKSYPLTRDDAEAIVQALRKRALLLFPDKGDTFDLIYGARFRRLIDERFGAA